MNENIKMSGVTTDFSVVYPRGMIFPHLWMDFTVAHLDTHLSNREYEMNFYDEFRISMTAESSVTHQ